MELIGATLPYTGAISAENSITVTAPAIGSATVTLTRGATVIRALTLTNGASQTFGPFNLDTNFRVVAAGSGKASLTYQEGLLDLTGTTLYTVATLPMNVVKGAQATVTDATTPTFNATVVGGGAVCVPVFYNGSAWVVG
jgi:hypothetical protein